MYSHFSNCRCSQEAKKWQDRKEALEALKKLTESPKLAKGDYGNIVAILQKVMHSLFYLICVFLQCDKLLC